MKIDEFIEKVDEVAYAQYKDEAIEIYWTETMGSKYSIGAFMTLNPSKQSLEKSHNWDELKHIKPENLLRVLALVQELRKTPVEERFPEKKYRLWWIDDNDGDGNYIDLDQNGEWVITTHDYETTAFTESQIARLKRNNPRFAPAIDAMKEEVKDDE